MPGPPTPADHALLRAVSLIVFDFDGVFTDNGVYVTQEGVESVRCDRSDGLGIGMLLAAGLRAAVLSAEVNPVVSFRCQKLKLECVQGAKDKPAALGELLARCAVDPSNAAYVGNDVNDVPCMKLVGFPIAVADAWPGVADHARFVTTRPGGHGAVREVCEWFLAASGKSDLASLSTRGAGNHT